MHLRPLVHISAALFALFLGAPVDAADSTTDRHPADPSAPAAPHEYHSAFADYKPLLKDERKPWRAANEEVSGTGRHAGHAMPRSPSPSEAAEETQKPQHEGKDDHSGR